MYGESRGRRSGQSLVHIVLPSSLQGQREREEGYGDARSAPSDLPLGPPCHESRDFLCQLCITYVEGKYKCSISKKYKLPKLKYQVSERGTHPPSHYRRLADLGLPVLLS